MDRIVIITGGNSDIGSSVALKLSQNLYRVILTYHRNQQRALLTCDQIKAAGGEADVIQLDLSDLASIKHFVDNVTDLLGRQTVHALVNNAGYQNIETLSDLNPDELDRTFSINVTGATILTQLLAPHLSKGGRVVSITSAATRLSIEGYGIYAASKAAIEVLTKYWSKELASKQITVNCVAPGIIETASRLKMIGSDKRKTELSHFAALDDLGKPEDVANAVMFLCSESARWITGERIEVSGGMLL